VTAVAGGPPSMEELGLNPGSLADCEAYDGYLMALEDEAINVELAREDAEIAKTDIEDQVQLAKQGMDAEYWFMSREMKLLPLTMPVPRVWRVQRAPRSRRVASSRQARAPTRPRPRRRRLARAA
jgi:hypothetical protein